MTFKSQSRRTEQSTNIDINLSEEKKGERILCPHCLRTANNGIKCKGICVADSDY